MEVIYTIEAIRNRLEELKLSHGVNNRIGFVPTMGFLHDGHASLLTKAKEECAIVVLSIYVNPLQFGPKEDFTTYPKDTERDLACASAAGVDIVFMPDSREMYPQATRTKVHVAELTTPLCGASRPGHFDGVATVVTKLLNIVNPERVYMGIKDAQQVAVVEQMVADLNMRVEVVICPTLRESDGLAMSSRNVYLQPEERKQAVVLSQALEQATLWWTHMQENEQGASQLELRIRELIAAAPLAQIDYVQVVTYPSLQKVKSQQIDGGDQQILVALAVKFGHTRLIDNRILALRRS